MKVRNLIKYWYPPPSLPLERRYNVIIHTHLTKILQVKVSKNVKTVVELDREERKKYVSRFSDLKAQENCEHWWKEDMIERK